MMETGEHVEEGEALAPRSSRKRNILIFTAVSLLNLGLLALLWSQLLTPAHQGTPADPLIDRAAPNFTLPVLGGENAQQVSLADFKGHAVIINFWSSTCQPCKDEMPLLETRWESVKQQGVVFLGIDVEDTAANGAAFLQQYGVTYTSVIDAAGKTLVSYGVTYTPETIFIDRSGKVISAVRMQITPQQLQDNLQKLLH